MLARQRARYDAASIVKDTLDHLPPKKQRQLRAVAELIRKEAEPEMVILFGSHARGDFVEDPVGGYFSDFDVLVIVKSPKQVEKHNLWSKIEDRARKICAPTELSIIVHDIKDVNEQLEKGFYFFSDIKKEGVLLYDSGTFQLAEAKERTPAERRAHAQMWFDQWLQSAVHFYETFEFSVSKGRFKEAAFLLHQATERLYHCALLVLTAYKPKTHNLEDLGKRAGDLHPALRKVFPRSTPEEERLFKLLKSAYVDARYSSTYAITAEELTTIAGWVRALRERVERVCRERIEAIGAEARE
jgi:predicted nucleotidyltransferase/HEPN domain-containing protein